MTYRVFAHNAVYPIGRSVVDFNATIEIAFLIFSFKCLDMIRPNLKMKMKREKGKSENEDIECPECNNIIPSNKDHCEICSWSYKKQ
jgi:hypothetical protein